MDSKYVDKIFRDVENKRLSSQALDHFSGVLDKLDDSVDTGIYKMLDTGNNIRSEVLYAAFGEKRAYHSIKKRLRQIIKMGNSSGEELKKIE